MTAMTSFMAWLPPARLWAQFLICSRPTDPVEMNHERESPLQSEPAQACCVG